MDLEPIVRVKTIDHVTIVVKDLDVSAKFYTDMLGLVPIERPAFGLPGLWFQAGSTQIHINLEGKLAGKPGLPYLDAESISAGFHFAFEVDDCDEATERLREQGLDLFDGPRSRPDGARQVYLYDPDKHLVELYSR